MYKVWIIGSKEVSSLFSAIWAEEIKISENETLFRQLLAIKKERKYAIIFITEDLMKKFSDEENSRLASWELPAIISIPSVNWTSWLWNRKIKKIVEKAIWADIF